MRIPFFKPIAGALAVAMLAATPAMAWHRHGGMWGPALAFGALGLATGAIIASSQPAYPYYYPPYAYAPAPAYGYGYGCLQRRPVYDRWGRYLGRETVNVCE